MLDARHPSSQLDGARQSSDLTDIRPERRQPTGFDRATFLCAFGKRLRARRDAQGMSQSVLAHTAGYVPQTISNIERGLTFPSLVAVFVFAEVLEIHPRDLLFGKE